MEKNSKLEKMTVFCMSKELNKWAFDALSELRSSKYEKRLTELPATPSECARALRNVATKNKWKIRASGRGLVVAILVISKAKVSSKSTRPPGVADKVEAVMREMKPIEVKRFHCQPGEFGAARAAVYRAREKIGVRFGTSKSKDGVLLIIRG